MHVAVSVSVCVPSGLVTVTKVEPPPFIEEVHGAPGLAKRLLQTRVLFFVNIAELHGPQSEKSCQAPHTPSKRAF